MERQGKPRTRPANIATEDIHKALDSYGGRSSPSPESATTLKASNRDSGVSECSSFVSDRLSFASDQSVVTSDSHDPLSLIGDRLIVTNDPLGAQLLSSQSEYSNGTEKHPDTWDERETLEKEWKMLFSSENYYHDLRNHALCGKLKFSKFRSIAWKLFLECLPEKPEDWIASTKQHREEYNIFKQQCLTDPSKSQEDKNLQIFNPLSQDETSPWKQYFLDNELKATIMQDLDRLYPEMEFFHSERVKEMMLNILFCHVKKNEHLGYKQGMHELLAPILYVLESDSELHKYLKGENLEVTKCLLDPSFIEHDVFTLFCQLMDFTETWYHQRCSNSVIKQQATVALALPLTNAMIFEPTAIVRKLNRIQDQLLRKHDTELWLHMKELDITPQVYGLRWIRLLFSREFPFLDVLIIWDAMFAEGTHLDLVDYIYIAMLQSIRSKLMVGSYNTCMSHLMKFPRVHNDVYTYVKRARNLRVSKSKKPPASSRPARPVVPAPPSASSTPKHEGQWSGATGRNRSPQQSTQGHLRKRASHKRPQSAFSSLAKRYTPFSETKHLALPHEDDQHTTDGMHPKTEELVQRSPNPSRPFSVPGPESRERSDSTASATSTGSSPARSMKTLGSELKTKLIRPKTRSRNDVEELEKDHERLQYQVMKLNANVDRMQGMFLYCGRKMDSYIGLLQEELMKDENADRDVIYLSLAGLKQVRDLLKGTLAYRGSTIETECDFIDIDNGIASRLQISTPNLGPDNLPVHIPVPMLANFGHFEHGDEQETNFMSVNMKSGEVLKLDISEDGEASEQVSKHFKQGQGDSKLALQGAEGNTLSDANDPTALEEKLILMETIVSSGKVQPLESYLEKHVDEIISAKIPELIPVVPCVVGSAVHRNQENKLSDDTLSSQEDPLVPGNINIPASERFSNKSTTLPNTDVSDSEERFLLDWQSMNDSHYSNASTPDEPSHGFVFVNNDGTARTNRGSPRLSPPHPLQDIDDDSY